MIPPLDPRVNAFRPDLADARLRPFVEAAAYAEPEIRQCVRGLVPMLAGPDPGAARVSEVRYGEFLDLFELRPDGTAWVQNRNDRTVGYIESDGTMNDSIAALMNRVGVPHTFVFAQPSIDSPVVDRLTLGSYVSLDGQAGDFYPLASGGFVFKRHIAPADEVLCRDYVFTAGQMMGAPFLRGGRTPLGLDPSGLVQLALDVAGIDCPRAADAQAELFGRPLPCHWRDVAWRRGDLVFFRDHVAILTDPEHVVHASPQAMQVVVEPLIDLLAQGQEITSAGRPDGR